MLSNDLDRETVGAFKDAIGKIQEDSERQWGTLTAHGMLRHLRHTFDVSLGAVDAEDESTPYVRGVVWVLFFEVFTNWPKGKLKAPAAFTPEPDEDFETEKGLLLERMDAFVDAYEDDPDQRAISPLLGNITLSKWSRLHGVHCRHHLKQFGVA